VLAACGSPTPAPAPAPTSTAPKLRDLATVDACSLLVQSDFAKPFLMAPQPLASPSSCRWATEDDTIWMSVENESLEQAKVRVRDGSDLPVEGRKAWWGVQFDHQSEPETSTGIVVTELAPDKVLVVNAQRTPPRYDVGSVARTRTVAILQKLVT
jgi:hypothetical protein